MGFPKCMEDNEELWYENNFGTANSSMYGFRLVSEPLTKNTKPSGQITNRKNEVEKYGRIGYYGI